MTTPVGKKENRGFYCVIPLQKFSPKIKKTLTAEWSTWYCFSSKTLQVSLLLLGDLIFLIVCVEDEDSPWNWNLVTKILPFVPLPFIRHLFISLRVTGELPKITWKLSVMFFFPLRNQLSSKASWDAALFCPTGKTNFHSKLCVCWSALRIGRRLHEILPFRWIELVFNLLGFLLLLQCNDRPCLKW